MRGSATSSTRSSAIQSQPLADHWVAAIFKRLHARYGSKWAAQIEGIEDEAVREWGKGLAGMSAEQISRGLESWAGEWPPSLPEFVTACKGGTWQQRGEAYWTRTLDKSKLLTSTDREQSRAAAREHLEKIREVAGLPRKERESDQN